MVDALQVHRPHLEILEVNNGWDIDFEPVNLQQFSKVSTLALSEAHLVCLETLDQYQSLPMSLQSFSISNTAWSVDTILWLKMLWDTKQLPFLTKISMKSPEEGPPPESEAVFSELRNVMEPTGCRALAYVVPDEVIDDAF